MSRSILAEMRKDQALSIETLLEPLKGRVAAWWIPDEVVRVRNMPLASTGKIDKMRLRKECDSDVKAIQWTG